MRLQLINDKMAEVEMNQVNKEVLSSQLRPLTPLKIPTSTFTRSKKLWRTRIGRESWLTVRINTQSTGQTTVKKWKKTQLFNKCGTK